MSRLVFKSGKAGKVRWHLLGPDAKTLIYSTRPFTSHREAEGHAKLVASLLAKVFDNPKAQPKGKRWQAHELITLAGSALVCGFTVGLLF